MKVPLTLAALVWKAVSWQRSEALHRLGINRQMHPEEAHLIRLPREPDPQYGAKGVIELRRCFRCLLFVVGSVSAGALPLNANGDPVVKVEYRIVDPEKNPFSKEPRSDLSVNVGGGNGVLIAPRWVLTASHCVSSKRKGVVPVTYVNEAGTKVTIQSDQVIRESSVDLALVRLAKPAADRSPLLLLKDGFPITSKDKPPYLLKKVAGKSVWENIPARVLAKSKGERFYVREGERQGKAGTSGSPWVIHSPLVGDVLVGVTHGTGRVPQVGKACEWIERTVASLSEDRILWATPEQALAPQAITPAPDKR